jgi:hypothetical protein
MPVDKAQVMEILPRQGGHELADRVNRELLATFDPSEVELLRGLDLGGSPTTPSGTKVPVSTRT